MATAAEDFFIDPSDDTHPLSEVAPAMLTALDSFDDRGRLSGSVVTLRRLIGLGLAEHRGLGVRITELGHRVLSKCMDAGRFDAPEHRVRYSHGSVPVRGREGMEFRGQLVESESLLFSAWCSCGFVFHGEESERRRAIRSHKQEAPPHR